MSPASTVAEECATCAVAESRRSRAGLSPGARGAAIGWQSTRGIALVSPADAARRRCSSDAHRPWGASRPDVAARRRRRSGAPSSALRPRSTAARGRGRPRSAARPGSCANAVAVDLDARASPPRHEVRARPAGRTCARRTGRARTSRVHAERGRRRAPGAPRETTPSARASRERAAPRSPSNRWLRWPRRCRRAAAVRERRSRPSSAGERLARPRGSNCVPAQRSSSRERVASREPPAVHARRSSSRRRRRRRR